MGYILDARNTEEADYDIISDWWRWFRFTVWPRYTLPDDLSNGIMIKHEGVNVCCGFIYRTSSSSLFWIEFIVSNPEVKDRELRKQSIRLLINGLKHLCREMGAKAIYTTLKNENLKKAYLDCGFLEGSKNCDEMVCNV